MAIERITTPGSTPSALADWQAVVAQLAALLYHSSAPVQVIGANVARGSLFNIGGVMYLATSDTTISGTQTDYVQVTASGASATAEFVASLSGVSWNSAYNGYYDGSGRLYIFDEYKAFHAGLLSVYHLMKNVPSTDLLTNMMYAALPNLNWPGFNRSASATAAARIWPNAFTDVMEIKIKNNSDVNLIMTGFRFTYANAKAESDNPVRLYSATLGVLASWMDTASYSVDVTGLSIDVGSEIVIKLQYDGDGDLSPQGPITATSELGLVSKPAGISPTLFEIVANASIGALITAEASY